MSAVRKHRCKTPLTNFSCSKSISFFIRCCSASYAALSGLADDEAEALTGTFGTEAELSVAVGVLDFLVPLAAGLVFGADMAVEVKREKLGCKGKVCRVRIRLRCLEIS